MEDSSGGATGGALGFMFQQTERYASYYQDEMTEEEAAAVSRILPYDGIGELYDPDLSDTVKYRYYQDATSEDLPAYFRVWWKMFWKHSGCYVQAILNNCYKFFLFHRETSVVFIRISFLDQRIWKKPYMR